MNTINQLSKDSQLNHFGSSCPYRIHYENGRIIHSNLNSSLNSESKLTKNNLDLIVDEMMVTP